MTPIPQYTYSPLGPQPGAFRLLRIKKGSGRRLEAELIHTTIDQEQFCYEAISYTWGDNAVQDVIHIGEEQIGITYNLSLILRDLRLPDADRIFWNDATCINQGELVERGHQVQQMGHIYRSAKAVLFCIGRPTELTDFLLDTLDAFWREISMGSEDRDRLQLCIGHVAGPESPLSVRWNRFADALDSDQFMSTQRLSLAFKAITAERWFRRVWIIQEVHNAQTGFVHCGRRSVPAVVFGLCGKFLSDSLIQPAARPVLELMLGAGDIFNSVLPRRSLYELIKSFSSSEASNDYDRIYALLGVATDVESGSQLESNYVAGPHQVICNTIRHMCHSSENFSDTPPPYESIDDFIKDICDLRNSMLLPWAAAYGYSSVVRFLLDEGAEPSRVFESERLTVPDSLVGTPLLVSAANGHAAVVEMLIATGQVDIAARVGNGLTPIYWAVRNGHAAVVELLLASCPINDYDRVTGPSQAPKEPIAMGEAVFSGCPGAFTSGTLLHQAAGYGHNEVCRVLLDHGHFNPKTTDWMANTPLHFAACYGHSDVVKLLLGTGLFDADNTNDFDQTPLYCAAQKGRLGVVELLLATGQVNVNKVSRQTSTPLTAASREGHKAVVKLLLATSQIDINKGYDNRDTPLIQAAIYGHIAVVELLLATGRVDVNKENIRGATALSSAITGGYDDIVKLLSQQTHPSTL